MACYNFYAVPDVELGGFPVTPLDTVISAVTTHINITTLNKLFFQNGRATKGMLVIKSEDANPSTIHTIKQNFNASINNVNNCLASASSIITKERGGVTIGDYIGEAKEKLVTIWTHRVATSPSVQVWFEGFGRD